MKKTELVKNAINSAVEVEDFDGVKRQGWLVRGYHDPKNSYLVLPFDYKANVWCYKVSHIKHIKYLFSGNRLW